jgi:hypothetical protein
MRRRATRLPMAMADEANGQDRSCGGHELGRLGSQGANSHCALAHEVVRLCGCAVWDSSEQNHWRFSQQHIPGGLVDTLTRLAFSMVRRQCICIPLRCPGSMTAATK